MIRYNYHTHTVFSDGKDTPEEMILAAISLGFHSIGFSDHAYTDFYTSWSIPTEHFGKYVETLGCLREKYKDRIKVYIGLEQDALAIPVPEGIEYYIGSVHWIEKNGEYVALDDTRAILADAIDRLYGGDADALAEDYYALVASYAEDPKVSFIGHFDLITKFDESPEGPLFLPTERYTAAWKAAAERLVATGKIFEINTGAISRGKRTSPYPAEDILAFLGSRGAKVIVSSDCHSVSGLDCAFEEAERLAEHYGCVLVDLF